MPQPKLDKKQQRRLDKVATKAQQREVARGRYITATVKKHDRTMFLHEYESGARRVQGGKNNLIFKFFMEYLSRMDRYGVSMEDIERTKALMDGLDDTILIWEEKYKTLLKKGKPEEVRELRLGQTVLKLTA